MKLAALVVALAGGCTLPLPIGAPMPATTAGHGHIRVVVGGELAAPDLVIGNAHPNASDHAELATAPTPDWTLGLAVGVARHVDVEAYTDGVLLPETLAAGARWQLVDSGSTGLLDVAIAARAGGGGDLSIFTPIAGSSRSYLDGTVAFAATSAVAELGGPSRVHLRVAAEAITASVHGTLDIHDYGPYTQAFDTMLLSTTVALPVRFGMAELAPYVATGELTNSPIGGRSYVVAGLALVVTPTPRVF